MTHGAGNAQSTWRGGKRADLLDVGGELGEGLGVGEDSEGGVAKEGGVPHARHAQQHRNVVVKWRRPEMLVHIVRTCMDTKERSRPTHRAHHAWPVMDQELQSKNHVQDQSTEPKMHGLSS